MSHFSNFTLSPQFYSITTSITFLTTLSPPLKVTNYMEWKKRIFFTYVAASAYHLISRRYKIVSLGTIAFLDTHVCIKNPYWQSSGITKIFLQIYSYLRYTDKLLDVFFLLVAVILSELHEIPGRKDWATEKRSFEGHLFLPARTPFYVMCFSSLFLSTHSFSSTPILEKKTLFQKMVVERGWTLPLPPVSTALQLQDLSLVFRAYLE